VSAHLSLSQRTIAENPTNSTADIANPLHIFLNISESAMSQIIPKKVKQFIAHGAKHQIRIYPKGTRIRSNNYNPVPYWRGGAQICAQNWQRFDKGMQLTRAMFEGTDGWLLKPASLLGSHARGDEPSLKFGIQRLACEILGASGGTDSSYYPDNLPD
jgi:phosphatidylinositol phospholipase C delta